MSTDQMFYSDTSGVFWVACAPVMAGKQQISPEILAANERLLALRQQVVRSKSELCVSFTAASRKPVWAELPDLPEHLGWGSTNLITVLRRNRQAFLAVDSQKDDRPLVHSECPLPQSIEQTESDDGTPGEVTAVSPSVKLYPDIGLAMLRQGEEAAGRLWLLFRHFDKAGQGSFRIDLINETLTQKTSTVRICGKRQLRNLLRAGEGIYWTRDAERLWLRSAARVAAALGVERLAGQPVALPLTALLKGIGAFRAHVYAAFHSGRIKGSNNLPAAMPITRATLTKLSGVGRTSQRSYEARIGLKTQANFAVGGVETRVGQEDGAWERGPALFKLKDYKGQQGRPGQTYLAWQLPNSYAGQHPQLPKGRQKRINRQLKDLVLKGMPGNGGCVVGRRTPAETAVKRYFANGRLAAQGNHPGTTPRYWRRPGTGNGRAAIWHSLAP